MSLDTLAKGFHAFDRRHWIEQRKKAGMLSEHGYKAELANYYADSDVRRAADYWKYLFGTPQNAYAVANIAALAGTGLLGATALKLYEKVSSEQLLRRALLFGGPPIIVMAALEAACSSGNGGGSPTVPSPTYVSFTNSLEGLIRKFLVNGAIRIQNGPNIDALNGQYTVTPEHKLTAGNYTAMIETNEGILRQTPVEVNSAGMLVDLKDGRKVPLDVVENDGISGYSYADYQKIAFSGLGASRRWLTPQKFGFYDRSLWERTDTGVRKINDNYNINATSNGRVISASVEEVVTQDMGTLSAGLYLGQLIRESQGASLPDPNSKSERAGWRLFYLVTNPFLDRLISGGEDYRTREELIHGRLAINANVSYPLDLRGMGGSIRNDMAETSGYDLHAARMPLTNTSDNKFLQIVGDYFAVIKHNRKAGQNNQGVPDNQP